MTEIREIVEDPWEYVRDKWNMLDVTCLFLMFVSLWFRVFVGIHSIEARSTYALSAPLAFTRILFFAQILPFLGPMIQVNSRQRGDDGGTVGCRWYRPLKEIVGRSVG